MHLKEHYLLCANSLCGNHLSGSCTNNWKYTGNRHFSVDIEVRNMKSFAKIHSSTCAPRWQDTYRGTLKNTLPQDFTQTDHSQIEQMILNTTH